MSNPKRRSRPASDGASGGLSRSKLAHARLSFYELSKTASVAACSLVLLLLGGTANALVMTDNRGQRRGRRASAARRCGAGGPTRRDGRGPPRGRARAHRADGASAGGVAG